MVMMMMKMIAALVNCTQTDSREDIQLSTGNYVTKTSSSWAPPTHNQQDKQKMATLITQELTSALFSQENTQVGPDPGNMIPLKSDVATLTLL